MALNLGSNTLAVDTMGGDLGPPEVVEAMAMALARVPAIDQLIAVGRADELEPLLRDKGLLNHPKISIHPAEDVIGMDEKPRDAYRKKNASMIRAIDLVRDGTVRGAVSCGNTGALMFAGTLMLRKLPGVERPALPTVIPSRKHHFILLDVGAQPETTARQLVHNAVLGSQYCRAILPYPKPRVGLLTIGTEEGKGTERIAQAHAALKEMGGTLNYIGLIEGFDTFKNVADVVVCDGFTGNVVLKTLESCYSTLSVALRSELSANPLRVFGALLSRGAYRALKNNFSPELYAGAPLLGLNGCLVKAHGSSNRNYICSAIRIALEVVQRDMTSRIEVDMGNLAEIPDAGAEINHQPIGADGI